MISWILTKNISAFFLIQRKSHGFLMHFWCGFDALLKRFLAALHKPYLRLHPADFTWNWLHAPFFYFTKNSYFANKILLKIRRVFDALLMRFSSKCIERAMRCPCIRVGPVAALLQKRGNITWFVHQSEFQFQIYSRYSVWLLPAFCVHGYGRLYTYICIYVCLPREE